METLGQAMKAWRDAVGWDVRAACESAGTGIQRATWSKLENDSPDNFAADTLAAVDRAFGWPLGTSADTRAGRRPPPPPPDPMPRDEARRLARLEERLEALTTLMEQLSARVDRVAAWRPNGQ